MKLISSATKPSFGAVTFASVNRYESLVNSIVDLIPREGSVLHVGCGDGGLAGRLASILPGVRFRGVERFVCKGGQIPIHGFNGYEIPFGDNSFDSVLLVDGLHGAENPAKLLREAGRVARSTVILKDKASQGLLSSTRRLIDRAGAEPVTSKLSGRLSKTELLELFADLGLTLEQWNGQPGSLNDRKPNWIFRRALHFTAVLKVGSFEWYPCYSQSRESTVPSPSN